MFRHLSCISVDYEQCVFSLGPSSKTPETRKWPGCRPRFSRLEASPLNARTHVHSPYRFEIWRKRETARSLAFARHLIYSLNKYNINVVACYSIQYSQYVKWTFLRLLLWSCQQCRNFSCGPHCWKQTPVRRQL